jgi:thiamine-monophosphate kinase
MRVSELGEFALIERLAAVAGIAYPPAPGAPPQPGYVVGLGDDAAVSERHDGYLIATTDTLVAGVHFPAGTAWPAVGWKALAVNVSDVNAMGGRSESALVTLGLPADFCVEAVIALYEGLVAAAKTFGVSLAGGDIVRSPTFFVTVAVYGWASLDAAGQPLLSRRGGGRDGDRVCVTGTLGDAAAGLRLLQTGRAQASDRLSEAQLRPRPPLAVGPAAALAGVRCAIDISDGLAQDLGHVARASGLAFRIEAARLPLSDDLRRLFPDDARSLALSGGEDYQLALIAPAAVFDALRPRIDVPLTEIGTAAAGEPGVTVVDERGVAIELARGGWDHLRS